MFQHIDLMSHHLGDVDERALAATRCHDSGSIAARQLLDAALAGVVSDLAQCAQDGLPINQSNTFISQ